MKTIVFSAFQLIVCGIETIGLSICVPLLGTNSIGLVRAVQTPDCLRDLTIQVTANPSTILYGESSVVSWSVRLPPSCGYTSVQLNGQSVAPSGSQSVTPSQSTTYQVTVFLNLDGASVEKTASTRVTVHDALTYFWCPYSLPSESVDVWQAYAPIGKKDNELVVQWLDESLNVPAAPLLLGSGLILDYNDISPNDLSPALNPNVPLLSACTFVPMQPGPDLDTRMPEWIDPTMDPSAT